MYMPEMNSGKMKMAVGGALDTEWEDSQLGNTRDMPICRMLSWWSIGYLVLQ